MKLDFDIAELTAVRPAGPRPWEKFKTELLATYKGKLRAIATLRKMEHDLDLISSLMAVTPDGDPVPMVRTTADLTVATIAALVETQPDDLSARTMISYLRSVRIACNVAVKHRNLAVSPFTVMPLSRWVRAGRPEGRRHLSRVELRTLLAAMEAAVETSGNNPWRQWKARRIKTMAAVAAYTGLRAAELYHLHVADVDTANQIIHVRPRKDHRLKTASSEAPVPMPSILVPTVMEWLAHRCDPPVFPPAADVPWMWPGARGKSPWAGGSPESKPLRVLQDAAAKAGVGHVTFQMLRRSLTTHLRGSFNVSRDTASRILRHSSDVDDQFYMQDDIENLRAAVKDVEF
jgi:integrase